MCVEVNILALPFIWWVFFNYYLHINYLISYFISYLPSEYLIINHFFIQINKSLEVFGRNFIVNIHYIKEDRF